MDDPTDPAAYRFWTEEHVRFADLDPLGHANNNAIGTFFEAARVDLFARSGNPVSGGPLGVVLARITIDFRAELHYGAPIRIGTRVVRFGRTSLDVRSAIFRGDLCAATSEGVCVLIDMEGRRPTPFPDALRARLAEIAG
ncbi:thioesterase family protein [Arenibaculum sp.]|uniref:acyl-CoA thioesterase n=1 Tax=Arenibaculum sp. TaxID=2865862 RepID=UPI002E1527F9|nr:thioesterase family protein [Arenibaculum sp.]